MYHKKDIKASKENVHVNVGFKGLKSHTSYRAPTRPELKPVSVSRSNWEFAITSLPKWDASPSHVYPQRYVANAHLYT